jgi:hypothetical protein
MTAATPAQLLTLASDLCAEKAFVVMPTNDGSHRVAAAAFAETYTCPDPTCRPDIDLTVTTSVSHVGIRHDPWCSELARRRAARAGRRKSARKGRRKR